MQSDEQRPSADIIVLGRASEATQGPGGLEIETFGMQPLPGVFDD